MATAGELAALALMKMRSSGRRQKRSPLATKAALQVGLSVLILVAVGFSVFLLRRQAGLLPWQRVPPYYASVDRARPFPKTLPPSRFEDAKVARAYEIAAAIPEVLAQQPSYCLLARRHHHSLLECFSTTDAAACEVCLKEAYLADALNRAGKTAEEIRSSIVAGGWRDVQLEALEQ